MAREAPLRVVDDEQADRHDPKIVGFSVAHELGWTRRAG